MLNAGVATKEEIARYKDPGLKERWLEGFSIYGVDQEGKARAQLMLLVSWQEHDEFIVSGSVDVPVHPSWQEEAVAEIDVLEQLFLDTVEAHDLSMELRFHLADAVNADDSLRKHVRRELHLSPGKPVKWGPGEDTSKTRAVRNLPEAKVTYRTVV